MALTSTLENLTRKCLPPWAARAAKRVAVYPRYRTQVRACRRGFDQYGHLYPQKVLFVAGLPKSGTTWLEKMISSYPGFHDLLIPEVGVHEVRGAAGGRHDARLGGGGSHDFELPADMFSRFRDMLVLTKMHVHGSPNNVAVLKAAGVRYVILYRDLRDVAVSNFFYVRNTPWHPEFPTYDGLSIEDGLIAFARRTLDTYASWVQSWRQNRDPATSLELRYEQMLQDDVGTMTAVAKLFELDSSPETVRAICEKNSFKSMSGGRTRGEASTTAFARKGVAGDWKNHFTPAVTAEFKSRIGKFLVEHGYEKDLNW